MLVCTCSVCGRCAATASGDFLHVQHSPVACATARRSVLNACGACGAQKGAAADRRGALLQLFARRLLVRLPPSARQPHTAGAVSCFAGCNSRAAAQSVAAEACTGMRLPTRAHRECQPSAREGLTLCFFSRWSRQEARDGTAVLLASCCDLVDCRAAPCACTRVQDTVTGCGCCS